MVLFAVTSSDDGAPLTPVEHERPSLGGESLEAEAVDQFRMTDGSNFERLPDRTITKRTKRLLGALDCAKRLQMIGPQKGLQTRCHREADQAGPRPPGPGVGEGGAVGVRLIAHSGDSGSVSIGVDTGAIRL